MHRSLSLLLAFLLLVGCTSYGEVAPTRITIKEAYSVDSQIAWSRIQDGKRETWTVDGPLLEQLVFITGLEGGDTLYRALNERDAPVYRPAMSESEIMEFVVDSLVATGAHSVAASNLHPAQFGSWPGFRFDLSFQYGNGLDGLGTVLGVNRDGALHLILYTGARLHYFDKHKGTVETIFASIQN